ncbi:signal transducer and activator of transcription 6 isoform X1 [Poecilia latipinna]|uniref:signal transducer and activator of transcription 6 isoform X1 n=1 Tax=Poecilia latipinna TaxID=48699 RepID=UPI00072E0BB6|nr:PREDICTED: signal transducer and activator of transcription 6-like isoform X1 [Poecilia latipinna]
MAQWLEMSYVLTNMDDERINTLYPPDTFPIEIRHYLCQWLEEKDWEGFSPDQSDKEPIAQALLNDAVLLLESVAEQQNIVERMKLLQITKNMMTRPAMEFAVKIRNIFRQEKMILCEKLANKRAEGKTPDFEELSFLKNTVFQLQDRRKRFHSCKEDINWEMVNFEALQSVHAKTPSEHSLRELQMLSKKIQELKINQSSLVRECLGMFTETLTKLKQCQDNFIVKMNVWQWEQHKSVIGYPFSDDLTHLQNWSEQLFAVNSNLRQEWLLIPDLPKEIGEKLTGLLQELIQSSFVVEKQPPQVIKTQSKFSAVVRYLLGESLVSGQPVTMKAQIINELQARNVNLALCDNVGELINHTAILDRNTATKTTNANFRHMSIKKIKRADRKGAESVTEEKFALMFLAEIFITGHETPFKIHINSQPVVVIVHGSQDINAVATIIWDCAFAEPDRVPFVVPDRVTWKMMIETLNVKFCSEVGTNHNLNPYNKHFLAQKIFDQPEYANDLSDSVVTWCQFNKEVLAGRNFTFWQWFEGAMDLTKKHLKPYWSDGLIFGFIGKQHVHLILKESPSGTFLLRFSDSEIGGITIAYVSHENGIPMIQNIQPFTRKDLEIRCLGDRIRDINEILYLYPNVPKHEGFKKFYTEQQPTNSGYIPVSLQTKVGTVPEIDGSHISGELSVLNVEDTYPLDTLPDLNGLSMDANCDPIPPDGMEYDFYFNEFAKNST